MIKDYSDRFLFGFDQDKLDMSILTGNLEIQNVNVKPDAINEILDKKGIPISLKAGLLSKVKIKVRDIL
jgi:hypothetical protein